MADRACLTITLTGVTAAGNGLDLVGVKQIHIVCMMGDVDGDGTVTTGAAPSDRASVYAQMAVTVTASNFKCDLNADGTIGLTDAAVVYSNNGQSASCTLPSAESWARQYRWDAENRLIAVTPASPIAGDKKVLFVKIVREDYGTGATIG